MDNQEMLHWWKGYVLIRIRGNRLERLINRMTYHRFSAWNVMRISDDEAQFCISLQDFFQLRLLLKETGCRVRIIQKNGLPFLLRRLKRRLGISIGVFCFIILLYLFSMMVWDVEIEGVTLPENQVILREELAKMGVKKGSMKYKAADGETIQNRILEVLPESTWVGFEWDGTKARIKVIEKTLPKLSERGPLRHLVAKKKAIIYDLYVEEGQPMVKRNQYVRPGDLLVSGMIGREEEPTIVSATGQILGEVWYEGELTLPLERELTTYTGEQRQQIYVNMAGLSLKLWGYGELPFTHYETFDQEHAWSWKEWKFPISFTTRSLREAEKEVVILDEEEAFQMAIRLSHKNLQAKLAEDAVIKEENVLLKKIENGKVYIQMHYTVIEDIASEQLIIQGD